MTLNQVHTLEIVKKRGSEQRGRILIEEEIQPLKNIHIQRTLFDDDTRRLERKMVHQCGLSCPNTESHNQTIA